ncbi:MAG: AraC family transcriptional regulator [Lachnospiraceae bacterium]|nr:AraC family transcriptional regulator [Lachnospiraceae bacterium]
MWTRDKLVTALQPDEIFFRELYLKHPDAHLELPKTVAEINRLIPESTHLFESADSRLLPGDSLFETNFPHFLDVMILRHARYSAAFKHSHSFFEVVCVLNGSCENHFATQILPMEAGDICIVAPETVHAISAFSDDCIIYNLMVRGATFEQTFLNSLPKQGVLFDFFSRAIYTSGSETYIYFKTGDDTQILALIEEMADEFRHQKNYYDVLLNSLLTNFFIQLLRRHEKDVQVPNPAGHQDEKNIIFILRYLTEHCDAITLMELSRFFNYSERQMARILKEYTGRNFTDLVQSIKLSKACELLKNPQISIQEIIDTVGYSNSSHFYRLFKKQYQITPTEYRKQLFTHEKIVL